MLDKMYKNDVCKLFRVSFLAILVMFLGLSASSVFAQEITYTEAVASLKTNRDRLLDSYALQTGRANRQQAWNEMTTTQKGVFLTITDLLGRRTFMRRNYNHTPAVLTPTQDDYTMGCVQMNESLLGPPRDIEAEGAYITPYEGGPGGGYVLVNGEWVIMPAYNSCELVDADTCVMKGHCSRDPLPRTDHDMALNHVVKIYAINGTSGGCGGGNNNRMFFAVDDALLYNIRNIDFSAPVGWRKSEDLAGPHSPFTQSRETQHGKPRGQMHEFAWDYQAVYMNRPGVYGVYDTHLVEMDIDYNWIHDSNPECSYGGTYGRYEYQNRWYNHGLGGSAEYSYNSY